MTVRTLFSIILKVLGIFFIKDILLAIPQTIALIAYTFNTFNADGEFASIIFILFCTGIYVLVAYWLLFKTEWIIEKFKLTEGFEADPVQLNMHRSTVLSICIIVVGALMFVNAVPLFIKHAITYYRESKAIRFQEFAPSPDKSYLISFAAQIIIGLLLMGNQRQIVNSIELRRRNKIEGEEEPSE